MVRITADDELRKRLLNFSQDIEICDDVGQVLARVQRSTPWTDPEQWELLTPLTDERELERRRDSDEPRYTTQQVLDHLRSLE